MEQDNVIIWEDFCAPDCIDKFSDSVDPSGDYDYHDVFLLYGIQVKAIITSKGDSNTVSFETNADKLAFLLKYS